jgi:uncharacterized damage-inducible protein DinB
MLLDSAITGGLRMKLTELFLAELDRENARSRRALDQMPDGKADWKPHDRSMAFGYLSELVATIPNWVAMTITQDELDIAPAGGPTKRDPLTTKADYVAALDKSVAAAKAALQGTNDEFLMTNWKLLAGGRTVMETPRHIVIRDTLNHLAHHRGQMTVYLRLLGAKVPSIYGPSADDKSFG